MFEQKKNSHFAFPFQTADWHVYRKWNERLFKELFSAYKAGRMGADPSTFWYQGELGFFGT